MNPVSWFEIPVTDMDRAMKFYTAVFGFQLTPADMGPLKMSWFPSMENNAYGATGSLVKAEGYIPSRQGTIIYFSVPDIEATLAMVMKNGGKTLLPKTAIGEYGWIANIEDSEGNRIALHTPPAGMK